MLTLPAKPPAGSLVLPRSQSHSVPTSRSSSPTYDKNEFPLLESRHCTRLRQSSTTPIPPPFAGSHPRAPGRPGGLRNRGPRRGQDSLRAQPTACSASPTSAIATSSARSSPGLPSLDPSDVIWTDDFHTILNSDADIVIELIGGLHARGRVGARRAERGQVGGDGQQATHRPSRPGLAAARQRERLPA